MMDLFENFARRAKDIDRLHAGETLLVGMPGSILAGQALLVSGVDFQNGFVDLHNITNFTNDRFSIMVRDLLGKTLTRAQDDVFIIKGGPASPHDACIITDTAWGDRYRPDTRGYYNYFANETALDIMAEGFGPDEFLVVRGHTEITVQELKDLLDRNIVVAVDAHPDMVLGSAPYEEAVEKAAHLSLIEQLHLRP